MKINNVIKLKPALVSYIWGGNNLSENFNKPNGNEIGEAWELSFDNKNPTLFAEGEFANKPLKDVLTSEEIGKNSEEFPFFPLLIKFIDAKDNLSIQVHPSDDYALKNENQFGKTELWYVLDAKEGAQICYGLKEKIQLDELEALAKSGEIIDKLNYVDAKKGDVFFVESGTIHAIGKGITVYEVQQNSTLTYRLFDYLRKDNLGNYRDLHINKAVDVSDLVPVKKINDNGFEKETIIDDGENSLVQTVLGYCKYFVSMEYEFNGRVEIASSKGTFSSYSCVLGSGAMNGVKFVTGDTIFVPANCGQVVIEGNGKFVVSKVSKFYLGVDIGGTAIKVGLVTDDGEILAKMEAGTEREKGSEVVIGNIMKLCEKIVASSTLSMSDIQGIGMGMPGTIDSEAGVVVYSNNIDWKDVHIKEKIEQKLNIEVKITNDANAAALGESLFGVGQQYRDSLFITLGTGVGSGIIINGKLYEGRKSAGAEIGHMVIKQGGELCTCGRRGCFETYSSVTGLIRETKKAMLANPQSKMWETVGGDIEKVDGKTSFDNQRIDGVADAVINEYYENLAEGLANLGNIFRPDAIILGGGLSKQGDNLTKPVESLMSQRLFGGAEIAPIKLLIAKHGNNAGLLGGVGLFLA